MFYNDAPGFRGTNVYFREIGEQKSENEGKVRNFEQRKSRSSLFLFVFFSLWIGENRAVYMSAVRGNSNLLGGP